jgi:dTDP-4-amino-4,6-dideoxygalactose transaminase
VFNTFEGGAIICPDAKTKERIDRLKNFGFVDELRVVAPGINGKMSEINAAFGMLQLQHIDSAIQRRADVAVAYKNALDNVPGITCVTFKDYLQANFSYFPILVDSSYRMTRDELYEKLKEHGIFARRYFYPLITDFSMYRGLHSARSENLPVATRAAQQVICLPIYPALTAQEQQRVIDIIIGE